MRTDDGEAFNLRQIFTALEERFGILSVYPRDRVWKSLHPTLASQTYDSLRDCIREAWNNRPLAPPATAGSLGYAGSLVPFPGAYSAVHSGVGDVAGVTPELWYAFVAAQRGQRAAPCAAAGTRGGHARKTAAPPTRYCWTHGLCAHSGEECRTPREGHVAVATLTDTRGGSTKGMENRN